MGMQCVSVRLNVIKKLLGIVINSGRNDSHVLILFVCFRARDSPEYSFSIYPQKWHRTEKIRLVAGRRALSIPMLVGASKASATEDIMGAKLAVLRNKSIKFYAASMGSILFLLSSTYIGKLLTLQIVAQLVVTGFVSF
ncbi:hypothetical protein PsorP6_002161 [Peronosclerospora sorghi]|uniref:Uncharacterized protein n=1 Tax=Peronosclerospora sorghi TaxID=230839 RepID=A0ACC0WT76_9STRA|nr:hypothetical protein PsorP6_002161 [Peronosclerospora sorghi]